MDLAFVPEDNAPCWGERGAHTHGLKLRLYAGLVTIIWLRADTMTRMRMGMTCTKRARPPCKTTRPHCVFTIQTHD